MPILGSSLPRNSTVSVAVGLRHFIQVKFVGFHCGEWLSGYQFFDIPIQPAAIAKPHLEPIQPMLPPLNAGLRAEAVLQKKKTTTGPKNSKHFDDGLAHILNAAKRECADDKIEGSVLERQTFAAKNSLINRDARLIDPSLGQPIHANVRIDGRDLANAHGVMRQIQSCAKPDLQNVTIGSGE